MKRKAGKKATVRRGKTAWLTAAAVLFVFILSFFVYAADFYRAEEDALSALNSDELVTVEQTEYGFWFDGPSTDSALIFYPGGKVDEKAYAPLLHQIAAGGMDVCLVKMPFRLAVFGMNRADEVMTRHDYQNWYIGGHSLGGAIAADYASSHGNKLHGLVLLAAYPTKELDHELSLLSVYGTEDEVLQMKRYEKGKDDWPDSAHEFVIDGGNHAQFGSYGIQSGDGEASIPASEQQALTAEQILVYFGIEETDAAA